MPLKFKNLRVMRKIRTIPFLNVLAGLMKKNLKLLLRSRSSALIVLLGPLLIIGLVGAAFNTTNFYNINIGTYSELYNGLSESVIQEMQDKQFNVNKMPSESTCVDRIKGGELHVCAVFPDNMQIGGEVVFHVDKTRVNLVWIIIDSLSSKISTKTSELSKEMTGVLLNTLEDARGKISENENALKMAIETNSKITGDLVAFGSNLTHLDLEYSTSDLGIKGITAQLTSAIGSAGASEDSFGSVFETIEKAENKSYEYSGKFGQARERINEIAGSMNSLGDTVSKSLNSMKQIAFTLSTIMGKINTVEYKEADQIVSPIKTRIEPVVAEKTHLNNMFPTLIILVIMFIGVLLSSTLVVREKTSPSYFRNFITPTGDGMFVLGDYATNVFVLLLQLTIIFGVSLIFFKEALYTVMLNSSIVLLLVVSVFIMLGMFIGQVFKSEETNTLGAVSISAILLFFSSTILPLETLPGTVRSIANLNPFVIGEGMLKEVMVFNQGLMSVVEPIIILLVYILVLGFLIFTLRKVSKRFL